MQPRTMGSRKLVLGLTLVLTLNFDRVLGALSTPGFAVREVSPHVQNHRAFLQRVCRPPVRMGTRAQAICRHGPYPGPSGACNWYRIGLDLVCFRHTSL